MGTHRRTLLSGLLLGVMVLAVVVAPVPAPSTEAPTPPIAPKFLLEGVRVEPPGGDAELLVRRNLPLRAGQMVDARLWSRPAGLSPPPAFLPRLISTPREGAGPAPSSPWSPLARAGASSWKPERGATPSAAGTGTWSACGVRGCSAAAVRHGSATERHGEPGDSTPTSTFPLCWRATPTCR